MATDKFDAHQAITDYRALVALRDAAKDDEDRQQLDAAIGEQKQAWLLRCGEDSLHERAFGKRGDLQRL